MVMEPREEDEVLTADNVENVSELGGEGDVGRSVGIEMDDAESEERGLVSRATSTPVVIPKRLSTQLDFNVSFVGICATGNEADETCVLQDGTCNGGWRRKFQSNQGTSSGK